MEFVGNVPVKNILDSPLKRTANVLEFYKDIFRKILTETSLIKAVNNLFPEGAYISQLTQHSLFPGGILNRLSFHQDPPHNVIQSEKPLGMQVCILLTDFTKENGGTVWLDNSDNINYLEGNVGDVYWWPAKLWHVEGVNTTVSTRSCLIMNIQSVNIEDTGFRLGHDEEIISFYDQYVNSGVTCSHIEVDNKRILFR